MKNCKKNVRRTDIIQYLLIVLLFSITVKSTGKNKEDNSLSKDRKIYNSGINITPKPSKLIETGGVFVLNSQTTLVVENKALSKIASYFKNKLKKSTGFDLNVSAKAVANNYIKLELKGELGLNNEGYTFESTESGIKIQATTDQGAFYGMQTLMQLLPAEIESKNLVTNMVWEIPCVKIKDEPRFKYRGQHLDVGRHFADVNYIKKQLDVLAMYKINRFHWHLTEDQGWRIEIKKYPKLTQIASKRVENEGNVYGPHFFTQAEIKEVVAYAKERFIEVIPEIELPGHAVAALTAYPEYSCTGGPHEVRNIWGISNDVFCGGNEKTFKFLTDIIEEVIPLFESEYFHIGGDEAPKTRWKSCPKCQKKIKELGFGKNPDHSAEEELQSYFIQRIEKVLLKHGKKMIGWDEILEGGLAPTATVMSWRGEKGGIKAGNMGHDVIMTPNEWLYLDHYQGDQKVLPISNRRYIPLAKTYSYDPIPQELAVDKHHHVLGVQANVWTEYMYTEDIIEWNTYPRILALSEIAWSSKVNKDYIDFERRLDNQRVRLDMHDINYYIPVPQQRGIPSCDFVAFVNTAKLDFETTEPVKMVYTTDGKDPNLNSTPYQKPLYFNENTILKIRSVLPSGKMSDVRTITLKKQTYRKSDPNFKPQEGFKAEYYKGVGRVVADIAGKTPDEVENIDKMQSAKYVFKTHYDLKDDLLYNTVVTGYINIPEDGIYYFNTDADQFWIDNELLISNEGQIKRHSRNDKSIALGKGMYPIKVVRLSGAYGGWPPVWTAVNVNVRPEKDVSFKTIDSAEYR